MITCSISYLSFIYSYAFDNRMSVAILRVPGGLDYSKVIEEDEIENSPSTDMTLTIPPSRVDDSTLLDRQLVHADSNLNISRIHLHDGLDVSSSKTGK